MLTPTRVRRALLIVAIIAIAIPQLVSRVEWPEGPFVGYGTVDMWPRQRSFMVTLEDGTRIGVSGIAPTPYAGEHIQIWGRWSQPTGSFATWMRGEGLTGWVYASSHLVQERRQPLYLRVFQTIRLAIEHTLHPVAQAMLLGDRQLIDDDVVESFDRAGTSHLLAASGLHLGILCGLVYVLLGRRRYIWLPILCICLLYMTLTGFRVSMVRASIMVMLAFVPWRLHRFERLGIALLVILAIWPHSIYSVSLWLSFTATAAILAIVPILRRLRGWYRYPASVAIATTAAQLSTLPIVLLVFERVSPWGVIANMVAIPIATVILSVSFAAMLIPMPIQVPFVYASSIASGALVRWVGIFS